MARLVWDTETPSEYVERVKHSVDPMMRRATKELTDKAHTAIVKLTPKSDPFFAPPNHQHLKDEIHTTTVQRWKGDRYRAYVQSNKDYAPDVEYSTRAHWIGPPPGTMPTRMLRFYGTRAGKWIKVARVWHPGTRGHHMFLIGTLNTEARTLEIVDPVLRAWAKEN